MDARLLGVQNSGALLPPPRRSIETFADSRFQFRPNSFLRFRVSSLSAMLQGGLSFPSELLIQDRNTFDTIFNISVAPVVQLGSVKVTVMPGLQYTIRRDTLAPVGHESESVSSILICIQQPDRQLALVFRQCDSGSGSVHGTESALAGSFLVLSIFAWVGPGARPRC